MTSLSTLARAARLGSARKRGVTLIEAVLYISIALALIVGGLVFFQQASLAQRTNSAVRSISAIASEVRGLYQQSSNFAGLTEGTLISAGAVPSSLINGAALQNEWGGAVVVAPNGAQTNFAASQGFTVVYRGVPREACVRLTTADVTGTGRVGSGIRGVHFVTPGTAFAGDPVLASAGNLTPTLVAGAANCGVAVNGLVDVMYTFTR